MLDLHEDLLKLPSSIREASIASILMSLSVVSWNDQPLDSLLGRLVREEGCQLEE